MSAHSEVVEIDGIYYNLMGHDWHEAEVTRNPNKYSGSIVIPESFYYQERLYHVSSIGNEAFSECKELTSVAIPNSVETIGFEAFYGCTGLSSITIPNSVILIGNSAFSDCTNLTSVHANSIESWLKIDFNNYASNPLFYAKHLFVNNHEIENLIIPNNITSLGRHAFACWGGRTLILSNCVTNIGSGAFAGCDKLESVIFSDSIKSIEFGAFYGCENLKSVYIKDIATWCSLAFAFCKNNPLHYAEHLYVNNREITDLIIPNNVTTIGPAVFSGCNWLTSLFISNGVNNIEAGAFELSEELTTVIIPKSIKSIDLGAFRECPSLKDFYCYADVLPDTEEDVFENSNTGNATLHVPASSIDTYRSTKPWKYFKNIVTLEKAELLKCALPTISYQKGKLLFSCETEEVEFVSEITDSDIKKNYDAETSLTATYHISVYATKAGYENSDIATATLCWIDQQPQTKGITNVVANIPARAVLIKNSDCVLSVNGTEEGTPISVYDISGKLVGSATSTSGQTNIITSLQPGSIGIVMLGDKSVKVLMR